MKIAAIQCRTNTGEIVEVPVAEILQVLSGGGNSLGNGLVPKSNGSQYIASGISVDSTGQIKFDGYGSERAFTGIATGLIGFTNDGRLITLPLQQTSSGAKVSAENQTGASIVSTQGVLPFYTDSAGTLGDTDILNDNGNYSVGGQSAFWKWDVNAGSVNIEQRSTTAAGVTDGYRINGKLVLSFDPISGELTIGNTTYTTTNIENIKTDSIAWNAVGGGTITDIAEDTAGNYTIIKPAENGTYATREFVGNNYWKLGGNALTESKLLGSTTEYDITLIANSVNKITLYSGAGVMVHSDTTFEDDVTLEGSITITSLVNAITDVDKFLVSDVGIVKYRTGAQLLSDIGAFVTPSGLTTGTVPRWNGTAFINSSITDSGTVVTVPNILVSGLTASQLVATDASKNLVSLSTATYPSLTELSYVKGATSSIQTQLNGKELTITPGTTADYWRGDKTWQILNKSAVGLSNVDNTTDLLKPISTATQAALDLKANLDSPTFTGAVALPSTTSIGSVTNTEISYLDGVTSSIQTQFTGKEPTITAGTTGQYWRGDKSWQTLNTTAVTEGTSLYFTNARAIASVLTGYISGAGTVAATDTILQSIQKLNGNIGAITLTSLGGINFSTVNSGYTVGTNTALTNSQTLNVQLGNLQAQVTARFTLPSLTAGSVLFSNGTTIVQDNSNLFFDDTNNRLGILTNNPGFDVQIGASNANRVLRISAGTGGTNTSTIKLGTTTREWDIKASASPYSISFDYVGTDTPVSNVLTLLRGGNVGVKNANPAYGLDVSGTGHFTGAVLFDAVPSTPIAPTTANHIVNKAYVDSLAYIKKGENVKTISFTTLTKSGLYTVNGYTLLSGDLVLDASGVSGSGVWVAAAGAWARSTLNNSDAEIRGAYHLITNGTYANQRYINTNATAITLDTTAITYALDFGAETDPIFTSFRDISRTANTVYAAGSGSGAGVGTWRALVAADIPSLTVDKISDLGTYYIHRTNNVEINGVKTFLGVTEFENDINISSSRIKLNSITGTNLQVIASNGTVDAWITLTAAHISDLSSYTGFDTKFLHAGNETSFIASTSQLGLIAVGTTLEINGFGVLNQKTGIVTPNTYRSVSVDTYGRVTAGTNPTTLAGYAISDAWTKTDSDGRYVSLSTVYSNPSWLAAIDWSIIGGKPSTFAPSAHSLDSHSNVTITSNTSGEILKWSGTAWINNTLTEAGIQPLNSNLTDISALTGTNAVLIKSGGVWSLDTTVYLNAINLSSFKATTSQLGVVSVGTTMEINGFGVINQKTGIVTTGTYRSVTVDTYGRVVSGINPTTLSGYGITDAQPLDQDLTYIAALVGSGYAKRAGDGTWSLDANTFLTSNQTITLSGIVTGSGTTSISTSIADAALTIAKTNLLQAALDSKMTTVDYPDLVAIEGLTGTSGLLRKTAANTWSLDTNTYALSSHTLDSHSNVVITSNSSGEILKWNGTNWVNNTLTEAGIQTTLVSGTTLKTVGTYSLLGSGDITIAQLNYWTKTGSDLYSVGMSVYVPYLEANGSIVSYADTGTENYTILGVGATSFQQKVYDVTNPRLETVSSSGVLGTIFNAGNYRFGTGADSGLAKVQVDGAIQQTSVVNAFIKANTNGVFTAGTITTSDISNLSSYTGFDTRYFTESEIIAGYQPLDGDLTAIAAISGTSGLLKKTAANTWSLDITSYLTGNQSITLSGIITGSGTTSITTAIADNALSISKTNGLQSELDLKLSITAAASTYQPLLPTSSTGQFLVKDSGGNMNFMDLKIRPIGLSHERIAVGNSDNYLGEQPYLSFKDKRYIQIARITDPTKQLNIGMAKKSNDSFIEAVGGSLSISATGGINLSDFTSPGRALSMMTIDANGKLSVSPIPSGGSGGSSTYLPYNTIGIGSASNTITGTNKLQWLYDRVININNGGSSNMYIGRKADTDHYGVYVEGGDLELYTNGNNFTFNGGDSIRFKNGVISEFVISYGGVGGDIYSFDCPSLDMNLEDTLNITCDALNIYNSGIATILGSQTKIGTNAENTKNEIGLGNTGNEIVLSGTRFKINLSDSVGGSYTPSGGDKVLLNWDVSKNAFVLQKINTVLASSLSGSETLLKL